MNNERYIDLHNHTHFSNLRLIDSICTPDSLAKRAIEIGLKGIVFSEHECLSESIDVCAMREKYPELKLGIGNEIYLTETREKNQKYFHFLLIALDAEGHRQLRELSSRAWMLSYYDRVLERVPTLKDELAVVVNKNPGHLIATTACLGGEASTYILDMMKARKIGDKQTEIYAYNKIIEFFKYCKNLFGDNFYIELPPGASQEQIIVNQKLYQIATIYKIKCEISCDSHYLKKEDRYVHEAFLNSKNGEREVASFYEYSYLQTEEEILQHLEASFGADTNRIYKECCETSKEIFDKIQEYDLRHPQTIPEVDVPNYPKQTVSKLKNYPNLNELTNDDNNIKRYWINECLRGLQEKESKGLVNPHEEDKYLKELEKEADIKRTVGERLGTNIFAYPVTLKHYIDLIWDMGSTIGAGRGSAGAGLNHWLLGITQYDPVKLELPFERYMNWDTAGLPDVDFDLCGSKRMSIINKVKEERGAKFESYIDDLSKQNLGCTLVATFGTASTRKAIQIACSGYRSEEYPDGIDVDTSQYLSSLIPSERGFVWNLHDTYYGNPEKGRKPQTTFINEVNQYDGLINIMFGVEGLIVSRGSHASGIILFDKDPYEFGCFMKTPSGDIITQYDLEAAEAAGLTKYDWLITSVQDKITETIKLLQEHGEIDANLTLRQVYNKYLAPEILNFNDNIVWDAIDKGNILDLFQFDSLVGSQGIKKVQPRTLNDLSNTNGIIRLMAQDGQELPLDKFVRYKNNINLWYQEMKDMGLSNDEMKVMEKYMLKSHGLAISQECIMWSLMDPDICNFNLAESNKARKIISKKKMDKLPALHEKVLKQAKSKAIGKYEWKYVISPSAGYGFSDIHSLFYSMVGFQTAYISTHWNPIYWNTACLIVNSGSLEEESQEQEEEITDKKERSTNYSKLAKALGEVIEQGIKVSLIDINKSSYGFEPDVGNNQILFGMKALSNVGSEVIDQIIKNRPYISFKDFLNRCPLKKTAMISLIKGGAFDKLETEWAAALNVNPRILIMCYYLYFVSSPKTRLTLQNFNSLVTYNLIPKELKFERQTFFVNKYLKEHKKGEYYWCDNMNLDKMIDCFGDEFELINGEPYIKQKTWDKIYKNIMDKVRDWLKANQTSILTALNTQLFKETWAKYATGNISAWEMQALCFYYHEHELKTVDMNKYGIVDFNTLPSMPIVAKTFKRNGRDIPIFQLTKIAGTVISKNDNHHSVDLLTTTGVVTVKFTKDYYARINRQISELQADGTKKVMEKGWTKRGTLLLIQGYRRDDTFVSKAYKSQGGHQVYLISKVNGEDLELIHERYGEVDEI